MAVDTYRVDSTDSAAGIDSSLYSNLDRSIDSMLLVCETASIRIANGTPTQGDSGVGVLFNPGDSLRISGYANCVATKWISAAEGVPGALQITLFYSDRRMKYVGN